LLNKRLEPTSKADKWFRRLSPGEKRKVLKAFGNANGAAAQD